MPPATTYQLETLLKAAQLYEGLASGKYGLYDRKKYKFIDPKPDVAQDRALALRNLERELRNEKT